jgi:thymidylate synthase (FAD)
MHEAAQQWIGKQIPVLDKGFLELQAVMGDDLSIVNAARVSFLGESKGPERDKKLLFYLLRNRHTSPFEMVEFKWRLRAPVVVFWQLVRHRTANINMQSGRYTPFEENDFYIPTEWRRQSASNKQASDGVIDTETDAALLKKLLAHYDQSYALYTEALEAGVAKEQARLFLPAFAVYYTAVWKIDAHNLMHFLSLRMAPDAQWEIRQYAAAMYPIFAAILPWTAEAFREYRMPTLDLPE